MQIRRVAVYVRRPCHDNCRFDYSVNATLLTSCNIESVQSECDRPAVYMWENHPTARAVSKLFCQRNSTYVLRCSTAHVAGSCAGEKTIPRHSPFQIILSMQQYLQAWMFRRGNSRMWRVVVCKKDMCCLKLSCQCKSTYVLWCWRVNITYCGGQMNVKDNVTRGAA
jgi:hypothetical protein